MTTTIQTIATLEAGRHAALKPTTPPTESDLASLLTQLAERQDNAAREHGERKAALEAAQADATRYRGYFERCATAIGIVHHREGLADVPGTVDEVVRAITAARVAKEEALEARYQRMDDLDAQTGGRSVDELLAELEGQQVVLELTRKALGVPAGRAIDKWAEEILAEGQARIAALDDECQRWSDKQFRLCMDRGGWWTVMAWAAWSRMQTAEYNDIRESKAQARNRIAALEREVLMLTNDEKREREQAVKCEKRVAELEAALKAADTRIANAESQLNDIYEIVSEDVNDDVSIYDAVVKLAERLAGTELERRDALTALKAAEARLLDKEAVIENMGARFESTGTMLQEKRREAEVTNIALCERATKAETQVRHLENKLKSAEHRVAELDADLDVLTAERDQLRQELADARNQLEAQAEGARATEQTSKPKALIPDVLGGRSVDELLARERYLESALKAAHAESGVLRTERDRSRTLCVSRRSVIDTVVRQLGGQPSALPTEGMAEKAIVKNIHAQRDLLRAAEEKISAVSGLLEACSPRFIDYDIRDAGERLIRHAVRDDIADRGSNLKKLADVLQLLKEDGVVPGAKQLNAIRSHATEQTGNTKGLIPDKPAQASREGVSGDVLEPRTYGVTRKTLEGCIVDHVRSAGVDRSGRYEEDLAVHLRDALAEVSSQRDELAKYGECFLEMGLMLGTPLREAADPRHRWDQRTFYERVVCGQREISEERERFLKERDAAREELANEREAHRVTQADRIREANGWAAREGELQVKLATMLDPAAEAAWLDDRISDVRRAQDAHQQAGQQAMVDLCQGKLMVLGELLQRYSSYEFAKQQPAAPLTEVKPTAKRSSALKTDDVLTAEAKRVFGEQAECFIWWSPDAEEEDEGCWYAKVLIPAGDIGGAEYLMAMNSAEVEIVPKMRDLLGRLAKRGTNEDVEAVANERSERRKEAMAHWHTRRAAEFSLNESRADLGRCQDALDKALEDLANERAAHTALRDGVGALRLKPRAWSAPGIRLVPVAEIDALLITWPMTQAPATEPASAEQARTDPHPEWTPEFRKQMRGFLMEALAEAMPERFGSAAASDEEPSVGDGSTVLDATPAQSDGLTAEQYRERVRSLAVWTAEQALSFERARDREVGHGNYAAGASANDHCLAYDACHDKVKETFHVVEGEAKS